MAGPCLGLYSNYDITTIKPHEISHWIRNRNKEYFCVGSSTCSRCLQIQINFLWGGIWGRCFWQMMWDGTYGCFCQVSILDYQWQMVATISKYHTPLSLLKDGPIKDTQTIGLPFLIILFMMTSSNGNISALLAFVRGIHRSTVNSPHKGQWRGAFMFSFIRAWTNSWANNRNSGDLRRHRTHYSSL